MTPKGKLTAVYASIVSSQASHNSKIYQRLLLQNSRVVSEPIRVARTWKPERKCRDAGKVEKSGHVHLASSALMKYALATSYADLLSGLVWFMDTYERRNKNLPADSSAGCSSDDSSLHTSEEALRTIPSPDDTSSIEQTLGASDLGISGATSGLQQGLDNIERGGSGSSDTTSKTTSGAVGQGVVARAAVHEFRDRLVGSELESGKGNGHGESGGVRNVEGADTLVTEDGACALGD